MATLIVSVLFGSVIAYFATQNTERLSLNFWNYSVPGIPIYIVVVGGLLAGLLLSWVISLVNSIITAFTIRGKESTIKDYRKENAELTKKSINWNLKILDLWPRQMTLVTTNPCENFS